MEKRIAGAEAVGPHKTSMLQDIEAGRGIEADALIGSVIELGQIANVPTPQIETVYACVKLLRQRWHDDGGRLRIEKPELKKPDDAFKWRCTGDTSNEMTTSTTLHDLLKAGDDQAPAIRASGAGR